MRANHYMTQALSAASVTEAEEKLRDLLMAGDRRTAVTVAIQAHLWPQAMLIASYIDPATFTVRDR